MYFLSPSSLPLLLLSSPPFPSPSPLLTPPTWSALAAIAPGTNYPDMGGAIQQSIYLSRAGQQLSCGSTLQPGEKLAVSGFAPPQDAQYVVQATSSSGSGSWGVQGGACSNSRTISSTSPEVVAPSSGSVTVQAAWATGRNGIMATAACSYSVEGTGTSSSTGTSTGSTGGTSTGTSTGSSTGTGTGTSNPSGSEGETGSHDSEGGSEDSETSKSVGGVKISGAVSAAVRREREGTWLTMLFASALVWIVRFN
ncbi:hypothetical protein GUITHDRAFT_147928 [Guillardia theta CCMP2712]|uniref:Uncharacterized protein n=1 Tax=Guillardia theta (strain CCMP2712) TaxID=905079 RepID=L1IB37_GUITC|nr:hypothetical protein GUITHDRAFT_147928 [Guillardia theta CCMP2712]EKX33438.1 hypothetical protein GUITHDRAFT_147928 [Guillardia theta CCMP2712]|eukprot:XP_005820418.1 hypothetical protein GUITHDRAFT_147928 [Guillardia theta CCMP2712]